MTESPREPTPRRSRSRRLWSAHGKGRLTDADAEAISCAIDAHRAALKAKAAGMSGPTPTGACGRPDVSRRHPRPSSGRRREKMFGSGRPRALDRNAKVRIMHRARCLARRTEKGRAYGQITAKAIAVLEAILWTFHNVGSGLCFPSYERIAEAAHCARSTVYEAIAALEAAGIIREAWPPPACQASAQRASASSGRATPTCSPTRIPLSPILRLDTGDQVSIPFFKRRRSGKKARRGAHGIAFEASR
jgi:hypothetical protein